MFIVPFLIGSLFSVFIYRSNLVAHVLNMLLLTQLSCTVEPVGAVTIKTESNMNHPIIISHRKEACIIDEN